MAKARGRRRSVAELEAIRAQIEQELAERAQAAAQPGVARLRRLLRAHRQAMRAAGPLRSLQDERIEQNLIRALEVAQAPPQPRQQADTLERTDGLTNAGLAGGEDDGEA